MPESEYVNVSHHAVTLASGRPLAPGDDPVTLDLKNPHDKALVADGLLAKADAGKEEKS